MIIVSPSGFEQTPINLMDIKINISSIISCIYVKSYFNIEKIINYYCLINEIKD